MSTAAITQQAGGSLPCHDPPCPPWQHAPRTVAMQPAALTRPVLRANPSVVAINPPAAPIPCSPQPKLLDRLREALRSRHYSRRTEQCYCQWVKRFIFYQHVRHPADMAEPEINAFLTHLAVQEKVSASTQNQALSALLFLYRHVLGRQIGDLGEVVRARRPIRLPVVLTRAAVKALLGQLTGDKWLLASLMYGAGLRLMECLRLRVQDVDLASKQIVVRDGKGFKDRVTMLPEVVMPSWQSHLAKVKTVHEQDLAAGYSRVQLPDALARKYPNASKEWSGQFLFPQEKRWVNPRMGEQGRHPADPAILRRVEHEARALGVPCVRLETGTLQPEALGLYRSEGYREIPPFGDYRPDPLSVFMEKRFDDAGEQGVAAAGAALRR